MPRKKREPSIVLGVASAITGVASIILFFSIIPSVILGLTGIVTGVLQIKHHRTTAAVVGLITGVVGILFSVLALLAVVIILEERASMFA